MSIASMSIPKPKELFNRQHEWDALVDWVLRESRSTTLGLVYGRRRQGKTMLLEALCESTGGLYWQARQQTSTQNLASLEQAVSAWRQTPVRLDSWEQAVVTLAGLSPAAGTGPVVVALDEIGYLLDSEPAFPSTLQAALSPGSNRRRERAVRMLLCGSAFGQMRSLIDAGAPLRGRAGLELIVRPFGFRETTRFWQLDEAPDAAFRLHALVGGTPAYRDFVGGVRPRRGNLDRWVIENVLASTSPLRREGRTAVLEDSSLGDRTVYWSVLAAVASGARARGEITTALGRPPTSLHHALDVLVESGWLVAERDPRADRGSRFAIDEPIVRLHQLVIEPADARLTRPGAEASVWEEAAPVVASRIYGPHLERLAREWLLHEASLSTAGGRVHAVGPAIVGRGAGKIQLDVLAVERSTTGGQRVISIGEVKATHERVGTGELTRLDRAAEFVNEPNVRRLLVSRSGFTGDLRRVAEQRGDVELIDLERLLDGN